MLCTDISVPASAISEGPPDVRLTSPTVPVLLPPRVYHTVAVLQQARPICLAAVEG
jgi:hypothetical protein